MQKFSLVQRKRIKKTIIHEKKIFSQLENDKNLFINNLHQILQNRISKM